MRKVLSVLLIMLLSGCMMQEKIREAFNGSANPWNVELSKDEMKETQ